MKKTHGMSKSKPYWELPIPMDSHLTGLTPMGITAKKTAGGFLKKELEAKIERLEEMIANG